MKNLRLLAVLFLNVTGLVPFVAADPANKDAAPIKHGIIAGLTEPYELIPLCEIVPTSSSDMLTPKEPSATNPLHIELGMNIRARVIGNIGTYYEINTELPPASGQLEIIRKPHEIIIRNLVKTTFYREQPCLICYYYTFYQGWNFYDITHDDRRSLD